MVKPEPSWVVEYASDKIPEAERLEQSVFEDRFGYDQALWEQEYRPYDHQSIWITLSFENKMIGALRSIVGSPETLKFSHDLQRFWSSDWQTAASLIGMTQGHQPIECATLSVLSSYRAHKRNWPVKALCSAFHHFVLESGATHAVQMLDPRVHKLLIRTLRLPFKVLPGFEPVDYHGLLVPVYNYVSECAEILVTTDKDYESMFIHRDETVTQLPPIDLRENSPTTRHRNLVRQRQLPHRALPILEHQDSPH